MTHKKFPAPEDPLYVPLHVGRASSEALRYPGDHTGDNISDKNCYYGELTGVYWVWKNMRTDGYIGICHYRRYFCTEEGRILTGSEYERILSEYDMITSKKLKLNYSYFDGYAGDYNIMDLIAAGEVIIYLRYYHIGFINIDSISDTQLKLFDNTDIVNACSGNSSSFKLDRIKYGYRINKSGPRT